MKSLVVYYSRTEVTKKLAEDIAGKTGADIEEIKPKKNYNGKIGYARGGKDAISEKITDIEDMKHDPEDYDVVYIGTPVWAGKASTPVFSYMKKNEGKFNDLKFFVTAGGRGFESTIEQMEGISKKPLKTLCLLTREVKKNEYDLDAFID